jgi:hypothetical protein
MKCAEALALIKSAQPKSCASKPIQQTKGTSSRSRELKKEPVALSDYLISHFWSVARKFSHQSQLSSHQELSLAREHSLGRSAPFPKCTDTVLFRNKPFPHT